MLHIIAVGAAEEHEAVADGLHHFGAQLFGKRIVPYICCIPQEA